MDWNKHQKYGTHVSIPILLRMDIKDVLMNTLYMSNLICKVTCIFIVCLYWDDLVITSNNLKMIVKKSDD